MAPFVQLPARAMAVAWGGCSGLAHLEAPTSAKPIRLWMVACHSSICSAAGGNLSNNYARAMAFVAVLGMDVNDVDRTVAWLRVVPAVTASASRPRCSGGTTGAAAVVLEDQQLC